MAAAAAVAWALAGPAAAARLYVPDPGSLVYETTALAAGHRIEISEGHLGDISPARRARLPPAGAIVIGNLACNQAIDLRAGSRITGDVLAGARVRRRGRVSGRVVEGTPRIALPALPTAAQAQALADRSFDHDMTFTDAVIDDVVFVAGDVRIRGSLDGAGTIIARGSIRLEKPRQAARLEPAAGTRLSLVALGSVHLEAGRSVRGVVVAGRDIELEWQNRFEGVLVAHRDIEVEEASSVTFAALDRLPPAITAQTPAGGSLLAAARPAVSAAFADDLSGVDPESFELTFDGVDQTSAARVTAAGFTFTPASPLAEGAHVVAVALRDRAGNLAHARWSFTTTGARQPR